MTQRIVTVPSCWAKLFLTFLPFHFFTFNSYAQTDSTTTERRSQQNVLLNASSSSMPRPISLGVPEWGVLIMEDGLQASKSPRAAAWR